MKLSMGNALKSVDLIQLSPMSVVTTNSSAIYTNKQINL